MRAQTIDHVALLPLYLASGAAVLALFAGRAAKAALTAGLAAATAAAVWVGAGPDRATFAVSDWYSYAADDAAMGASALFAALALLVAALSGHRGGEYWFLLGASAAGGIALAGARDLVTLIVAVETLTLPLYVLVTARGGSRRAAREGAEAGVTFLIASVTASATALMGAALLYAASGTVHLGGLGAGLDGAHAGLTAAGLALLLGGLAFKLAAAPLHAWAPLVLERAPLPVATYLASASKLGGAVAVVWVVHFGLSAAPAHAQRSAGLVLAVLAVASIAVGNLAALVQRRTVPLLAWSGIAHAGYALAPLAVLTTAAGRADAGTAASAAFAYAVFFVLLEAGAFTALTAVRPSAGAANDLFAVRPAGSGTPVAGGEPDTLGAGSVREGIGADAPAAAGRETSAAGSEPVFREGRSRQLDLPADGDAVGAEPAARGGFAADAATANDPDSEPVFREGRSRPADAPAATGGKEPAAPGGLVADPPTASAVPGDGGLLSDLSGLRRSAPLPASVLVAALVGLAGLPPALAGTFAKVAVLEVLASSTVWLAVVVAAGAVLGLAYYLPLARAVLMGTGSASKGRFTLGVALVGLALAAVSLAPGLVLGFTSLSQ